MAGGPDTGAWHRSSRSGANGGACVEVAAVRRAVAVRDSKNPHGPKLAFTATAWRAGRPLGLGAGSLCG